MGDHFWSDPNTLSRRYFLQCEYFWWSLRLVGAIEGPKTVLLQNVSISPSVWGVGSQLFFFFTSLLTCMFRRQRLVCQTPFCFPRKTLQSFKVNSQSKYAYRYTKTVFAYNVNKSNLKLKWEVGSVFPLTLAIC